MLEPRPVTLKVCLRRKASKVYRCSREIPFQEIPFTSPPRNWLVFCVAVLNCFVMTKQKVFLNLRENCITHEHNRSWFLASLRYLRLFPFSSQILKRFVTQHKHALTSVAFCTHQKVHSTGRESPPGDIFKKKEYEHLRAPRK